MDNVEAELSESSVERSDEVNTLFTVAGEQPITRAIWRKPAPSPAIRWAPNTRKAYVPGWNGFTIWCIENRCPGLPSSPADVGRYLEHLVETEGQSLPTARTRLAAIAAAHRLGRHPDPGADPLVEATLKRLAREYVRLRRHAKGLTAVALAAIRATARIQRVHLDKRRPRETEAQAAGRGAVARYYRGDLQR